MSNPSRLTIALLFALHTLVAQAADWPRWRGPNGDGHVPAGSAVIEKLPAEIKSVWRIKVGEGLASPVVAGGKVFCFDAVDGKETLRALDANTAGELWRATIDDTFRDQQGPAGPRCTPVVDGERVYAASCKGELQCLTTKDGKLVWRANYVQVFQAVFIGEKGPVPGAARHGNNGSPLIQGDRLYACVGGTNGASVVCFDKRTGKVIWKSQNDQAGYAPPVITPQGHLLAFTVDGLLGLRASNGDFLFRIPIKTAYARHVTTPVWFEDVAVVSSHQVGMLGIKISATGTNVTADTAWVSKDAAMNFSSPVAVGRHLYGLGPRKNLVCVDIPTGQLKWSQDGYFTTSADKAHGAFIVMGNNILALTDGGELVMFAADPDAFKELGRVQVCAINWCNPAYADGRLYLRDGNKAAGELMCLELIKR